MSNPAAELEREGSYDRAEPNRSQTLRIAAWSFAAWVAIFLIVYGIKTADETQRELRLIPDLQYDSRVDFAYFYAAASMVWHGDLQEVYPGKYEYVFYPGDPTFTTDTDDYTLARLLARGNYYNPPLVAILQAPLTAFSFKTAFWVFSLASGLIFLAFVLLFWRAGAALPEIPLLIIGVGAFRPVHEAIIMGHLSLFLVFALGAGFLALRSKQPVLAGLALSLLALKPQWALLPGLFLVWRGEWRALAVMSVGSALLFVLPFIPAGTDSFRNYVQFLRDQSNVDLGNAPHMFSWNGFLSKLEANDPLGPFEYDVNKPLLYSLQFLTALTIVVVWWGRDLYLGVAATILGMLLLSTHSVWYDWSFLVVAAAFLALRPAPLPVRAQVWFLLLALFVSCSQSVAVVFAPDGRHGFVHWSEAGFFAVTLIAFAALVWCAGRTVLDNQLRLPRISAPLPGRRAAA